MARYTVQLRKIIETVGEDQVLKWFQDYDLTNYLTFEEINSAADFAIAIVLSSRDSLTLIFPLLPSMVGLIPITG